MSITRPATDAHRFALDEYHRLIESGGFDEDARVELIEGTIADMSPKTPEHEQTIAWMARWLMLAVDGDRFEVRVCGPLTIDDSEPEPDLTVVARDAPRPYHPSMAALVVEVAVSSQYRDLRQKPAIYARAVIPEYWVVDLDAARIVVHRGPRGGDYSHCVELDAGATLVCESLDLPALDVNALLAAAARRR